MSRRKSSATADVIPGERIPQGVATRSRIPSSAWKMGVFATSTLLLLGLLATLIGNISFVESRTYYARFTDATGVLPGDRVRISGVEVGSVRAVRLVDVGDGRRQALVEFRVESDVPVSRDARLALRYENIVGQRYLAIEQTSGADPMAADATFPVSQTTPALSLTQLFNGFQPLLRAVDPERTNELSYEIVRAFQGESGVIEGLLRDTASLTGTLADKDAVIGRVVTNLDDVLATVGDRDRELTALIVRFRDLMVGLSSNRDVIAIELPRLGRLLDDTGGMIRDIRPPLARTVSSLAEVAEALHVDRDVLDASLKEIPRKLRLLARTGSYGSWFNFYACGVEVRLRVLGDTLYLGTPGVGANERDSVCGGADEMPPGFPSTRVGGTSAGTGTGAEVTR